MAVLALVIAAETLSAQPAAPSAVAGPEVAGPPLPRIVQRQRCQASDDPDEVVVCGQSQENSPYRIPRELRDTGEVRDEHASFDAQTRDMEALERFSSQNIGHSGMSQHSRQVDCEWRAARQVAAGRRPDCGRRRRSGE
ncbi:hypothetical protein [Sphingosinicella sp. YJ22]|uniref:hypothetical protein n=1 Tax=Sphingosinicella sp. YJ22 TaxID=1104780 RepID=UPI00140D78CC|nr:hypothetical protein [Sphingosinicella sp. YJ22]